MFNFLFELNLPFLFFFNQIFFHFFFIIFIIFLFSFNFSIKRIYFFFGLFFIFLFEILFILYYKNVFLYDFSFYATFKFNDYYFWSFESSVLKLIIFSFLFLIVMLHCYDINSPRFLNFRGVLHIIFLLLCI